MDNQKSDKNTVRAVERALDILLTFTDTKELGLGEIAKQVSLHKSTVYRLIQTLEQKGFIIKSHENEKYRLGFKIIELSSSMAGINDPATLFHQEMINLKNKIGETISLYVRDGFERIRIQAVESDLPIRRVAPVGARLPLSVGAASKVLVAFENSPSEKDKIIAYLAENEGINTRLFNQGLKQINKYGYATSFEEREVGAASIAFPIFNHNGKMIAAISVSGPVNRLTNDKMLSLVVDLQTLTTRLSKLI